MSCTRRGFLKTVGAAMVGLGLTQLGPMRAFAASTVGTAGERMPGGPTNGPYSADGMRARAVDVAEGLGDRELADYLRDVCCWAPAAAAIRERPLAVQEKGFAQFFEEFPGGHQLAEVGLYSNNTIWRTPRFRFDPENEVQNHYQLLDKPANGIKTEVLTPSKLNGQAGKAELGLMLDRKTGERLQEAASDRAEPMWGALSLLSGIMLDPTDDLTQRLLPRLSFYRTASDRSFARNATVRYNQVVLGAAQRAVYSDQLGGANAALPLVKLSAGGYLPLGEVDDRFVLVRFGRKSALGA
jgi:hypothetical protein